MGLGAPSRLNWPEAATLQFSCGSIYTAPASLPNFWTLLAKTGLICATSNFSTHKPISISSHPPQDTTTPHPLQQRTDHSALFNTFIDLGDLRDPGPGPGSSDRSSGRHRGLFPYVAIPPTFAPSIVAKTCDRVDWTTIAFLLQYIILSSVAIIRSTPDIIVEQRL